MVKCGTKLLREYVDRLLTGTGSPANGVQRFHMLIVRSIEISIIH